MESLRIKKDRPSSNSKRNMYEFGIAHKNFRVGQKTELAKLEAGARSRSVSSVLAE